MWNYSEEETSLEAEEAERVLLRMKNKSVEAKMDALMEAEIAFNERQEPPKRVSFILPALLCSELL